MVALRTCASGSKFLLPSRYDADRCMSKATLNRVTQIVAERAKEAKLPLEPFLDQTGRQHAPLALARALSFLSAVRTSVS